MAFEITLSFVREHDLALYEERVVPRLRGVAARLGEVEGDPMHRLSVKVTSPSAAKDVVSLTHGFLAHAKNVRVDLSWPIAGGGTASGQLDASTGATGISPREADLLAIRVAGGAKLALQEVAE
jgi:hypothetical protein